MGTNTSNELNDLTRMWIRIPQSEWPVDGFWDDITDPVCPLLLALPDHPDTVAVDIGVVAAAAAAATAEAAAITASTAAELASAVAVAAAAAAISAGVEADAAALKAQQHQQRRLSFHVVKIAKHSMAVHPHCRSDLTAATSKEEPVSYTHLTLPTICSV